MELTKSQINSIREWILLNAHEDSLMDFVAKSDTPDIAEWLSLEQATEKCNKCGYWVDQLGHLVSCPKGKWYNKEATP